MFSLRMRQLLRRPSDRASTKKADSQPVCAVEHALVTGRQRVSGCYFSAACVTLMVAACFIVPMS